MARGHLAAYVLHSWGWSESSLIVDLFTREQGRIVVVAKGAKKPHSNLRAVLLPLQRIVVGVGRGPAEEGASEVQTLRSAEWAGPAPMPSGAALFAGFYLNELLMKLLARHDPHPALFDAYAWVLERLADEPALRAFELLLLKETGVLPELATVTLTQQPVRAGATYALRHEAGVVDAQRDDAVLDGAAWIGMQAALQHGSPDALREACAGEPALKPMLRALLHYHLGGSSLRTRDVMLGLQDL
jgi:DNA repair protein RecO (recombination protein O)